MSDNTDQQTQSPNDLPEYLKFLALLVVLLVVVLGVAALGPRLIAEVPFILGLGGAPAAEDMPAAEPGPSVGADPAVEEAPAAQPEGTTGPEQASPAGSQDEMEAEIVEMRHEVQEGQTLYQLAELYGVSMQEIAAANNLVNPAQLQAGAVLIIPQPE